jgi:hypothetical protein
MSQTATLSLQKLFAGSSPSPQPVHSHSHVAKLQEAFAPWG